MKFIYDGVTGLVVTDRDVYASFVKVEDSIGLQDGSEWQNDPDLTIRIQETVPAADAPTFNLSIFTN